MALVTVALLSPKCPCFHPSLQSIVRPVVFAGSTFKDKPLQESQSLHIVFVKVFFATHSLSEGETHYIALSQHTEKFQAVSSCNFKHMVDK